MIDDSPIAHDVQLEAGRSLKIYDSDGSLTYDMNKNKTAETIGGVMQPYGYTATYDDDDRLASWTRDDSNLTQSWNLSPVGDWNTFTENSVVENRTHGPTHELLSINSTPMTYDAKGNLTTNSDGQTHTWDFNNKMRSGDIDGDQTTDVTQRFDALGRRVYRSDEATETVYAHAGTQTVCDYAPNASVSTPSYQHVYASYIDEPVFRMAGATGERIYIHCNQQFSVAALTNSGGFVAERSIYNAYGTPTFADSVGSFIPSSDHQNRYGYTGREYDEIVGFYYFRARMYDSRYARFVSRDPIGFEGGSMGLHNYIDNNPTRRTDPMGLDPSMVPTSGNCKIALECTPGLGSSAGLGLHCGVATGAFNEFGVFEKKHYHAIGIFAPDGRGGC